MAVKRREFLKKMGQVAGLTVIGGTAARLLLSKDDPDATYIQPKNRFAWQIDPDKCRYCGICKTACVRQPSAVKAVNDQKKCSYCVVCYGHISNHGLASDEIVSKGKLICPLNAVKRENYCGGLDGYYLYSIDHDVCDGCGECVKQCCTLGSESMFLTIRPDLCLGCNQCSIATACPHNAILREPIEASDSFKGYYDPDEESSDSYGDDDWDEMS